MRLEFRLSILAIVVTLVAFLVAIVAIDLTLTRIEWDRHHSVQRARAEVEFPDLAPRSDISLSRSFNLARIRFDIDAELSIPTWFNAMLFVVAAMFVLAAAVRTKELRRPGFYSWMLIAGGLFYFSIDEMAQLHELLGGDESIGHDLNEALGLDFINFDWVIPGVIGLLVVVPLLIPFFWRLPRWTFAQFVLAGVVWVAGAVVLETYQGDYVKTHSIDSWSYHVLSATEETLEMAGLILFIAAMLLYWRDYLQSALHATRAYSDADPGRGTTGR